MTMPDNQTLDREVVLEQIKKQLGVYEVDGESWIEEQGWEENEEPIKQIISQAVQKAVEATANKMVSEAWKCRFLVKPDFDDRPLVTHGDLRSVADEIIKNSLTTN